MKYNTPNKRRVLYRKSEQNKYDLEHKKNSQDNPKFANNIINAIQTLYDTSDELDDSDYEQIPATLLEDLWDVYYSVTPNIDFETVTNAWGNEY